MANPTTNENTLGALASILEGVKSLQKDNAQLASAIDKVNGRVDMLVRSQAETANGFPLSTTASPTAHLYRAEANAKASIPSDSKFPKSLRENETPTSVGTLPRPSDAAGSPPPGRPWQASETVQSLYPSQLGINPISLNWGESNPGKRGPVVASWPRSGSDRRNSVGAHRGPYSIYRALAIARGLLDVDHKTDFTNTEPVTKIGPYPQWSDPKKIVTMDPWGHLAPWLFRSYRETENIDIRPTVAITRAHLHLPEIRESVRSGRLVPDGKVCLNGAGELSVTKIAVEPVWYLPGVAERLGIEEGTLRRVLFEETGGSYPELITRSDMKVFLPPIGSVTVYIFGDLAKTGDPNAQLALRIHDECNGSDVFGSDICSCRPYLIFAIEEAVKQAQKGGCGVIAYFRKEARACGEVTKYLIYNARKRGIDRASQYFNRIEGVAGVRDMRVQALAIDILHWLGITKIDRMLSMSNEKYDAIVSQGIPIHERVPIPDELVPQESRVEVDAKIDAGFFTLGRLLSADELSNVRGRAWEDMDMPGTHSPSQLERDAGSS